MKNDTSNKPTSAGSVLEYNASANSEKQTTLIEKWESLTIKDRFIFNKVMSDPENSLPLINMLLPGANIDKIEIIETEKTQEAAYDSRGVRYDVYIKDVNGVAFTLEMQARDEKNLPLRSRYYSSLMDEDSIGKGSPYNDLNPTYIIFICPFDCFGLGFYRYTFYNTCEEEPSLSLGDRAEKIFLNASGTKGDIPDSLKAFLDYVAGINSDDPYIARIANSVRKAKMNKEWRSEYMRWEMELAHVKSVAREEAYEEMKEEVTKANAEKEAAVAALAKEKEAAAREKEAAAAREKELEAVIARLSAELASKNA